MRPLKIRLGEEAGEEGLDSGGVQQEFFRLAVAEALNPDYGMSRSNIQYTNTNTNKEPSRLMPERR